MPNIVRQDSEKHSHKEEEDYSNFHGNDYNSLLGEGEMKEVSVLYS